MTLTHLNPSSLHTNPAYSQGTLSSGGRTLYVGGQNGTDSSGAISGGIAEQTTRAIQNVLAVLAEAGGTVEQVAKLTLYLVESADLNAAYEASLTAWGRHPTAITALRVAGLGRPEALIEIDAIAVIP